MIASGFRAGTRHSRRPFVNTLEPNLRMVARGGERNSPASTFDMLAPYPSAPGDRLTRSVEVAQMMVFWWTGRGYFALLTLIGIYGLFGAIATYSLGETFLDRHAWVWGIGMLVAAYATWLVGCRINRKARSLPQNQSVIRRILYKARHRFMGLPMESWSIPAAGLGVFLLARGFIAN